MSSLMKPLNNLIIDKLKEIKYLQNNIKLKNLEYTAKNGHHNLTTHPACDVVATSHFGLI